MHQTIPWPVIPLTFAPKNIPPFAIHFRSLPVIFRPLQYISGEFRSVFGHFLSISVHFQSIIVHLRSGWFPVNFRWLPIYFRSLSILLWSFSVRFRSGPFVLILGCARGRVVLGIKRCLNFWEILIIRRFHALPFLCLTFAPKFGIENSGVPYIIFGKF